jgi:hypothetical protein
MAVIESQYQTLHDKLEKLWTTDVKECVE